MIDLNRKVIVVTDGDSIAKKIVEKSAAAIGGRCLSISWGNPTKIAGEDMVRLIQCVKHDPVVIMADDRGNTGRGNGEKVINYLIENKEVDLIGIVAVASNTKHVSGIKVDCSIDRAGNIIDSAVDKHGNALNTKVLVGDTINTINYKKIPSIVGIGDPGKIVSCHDFEKESIILTKALRIIINKYNKEKEEI